MSPGERQNGDTGVEEVLEEVLLPPMRTYLVQRYKEFPSPGVTPTLYSVMVKAHRYTVDETGSLNFEAYDIVPVAGKLGLVVRLPTCLAPRTWYDVVEVTGTPELTETPRQVH